MCTRMNKDGGNDTTEFQGPVTFHGMVADSPAMRRVFDSVRLAGMFDVPVLITGQSGTGKELVARAVHEASPRRGGPFVPVNCGALPETVLESEFFGHVSGAFTGAVRDRKGRFALAERSSLTSLRFSYP